MNRLRIILTALLLTIAFTINAQSFPVKGRVLGPDKTPVKNAEVSLTGLDSLVMTDENGEFRFEASSPKALLTIKANGFYPVTQLLAHRNEVKIMLIPTAKSRYSEEIVLPINGKQTSAATSSVNLGKKDFGTSTTIEEAMKGAFAGLRVTGKSGMPTEGAYFNLRGTRTLLAENQPLVVINGIPYMPNTEISPLIGGYSRSLFYNYDLNDIANITVLKGADAAIYGSMGANGVILIETDGASSEDLNTRISFNGQYGYSWNDRTLPLLDADDYKRYIADIGTTYYPDMAKLHKQFPFLKDDPEYYYNYLYNNNTDWQEEIYSPAFFTDNVFRIEGGDAIAKYDISLGYRKDGGVIDNTSSDRYHTQINTNITVSRKFEIFTTVGLAYATADLMEQGIIPETNPMLAAYAFAPVFSPYAKDPDNGIRPTFNTTRYGVSNPVALTHDLEAKNKIYDINVRAGLKYKPSDHYTLTGTFGLYYNYNQESMFIPGRNSKTIITVNGKGEAANTSRSGVGETINMFYNVNGSYNNVFQEVHALNANVGMQILTSRKEYDAGEGYVSTANDFYKTLNYTDADSRNIFGYINQWNWMNFYAHADYTYNNLLRASANVAVDAASSIGVDATRFSAYPSAGITFMAKNLRALLNSSFINRLDIRGEYGLTGNSRFSSNYGKNYYSSIPFQELSGIVRNSGIPNTGLKPESTAQLNLGIDLSLYRHRLDISADYYQTNSTDVLMLKTLSSSVYGPAKFYDNTARIVNEGVELSLRAALLQTKNFEWVIGGNIAFQSSKVKKLGGEIKCITVLPDGAEVVTRLGANPFAFYGYETNGVYATNAEAAEAGLVNSAAQPFSAGDIRFVDRNHDGRIDDEDKTILGKASPDYFGGFYTSLRYKNWMVSAEFAYSYGNDAYNAVRRRNESLNSWNNQSKAVFNRWQVEGQVTDVPRAVYGDPMDNSRFSDRWIEDASFLKLRNVTLSYTYNKPLFNFFRSVQVYASGDNLYTWTKYLGLDPEFAYSYGEAVQGADYAKVIIPKSVKFGINLKF